MRIVVNDDPVKSNPEILLFDGDIQIQTIPILENDNIVDLLLEQFKLYEVTNLDFLAPAMWANNIIRHLKRHEIDDNVQYKIFYEEGKRRSQE